jgi:hypothetical protein
MERIKGDKMIKYSNINKVYNSFNQQGGTIHQLREKLENSIKTDKVLTSIVIDGYLEYLFNLDNETILNSELNILQGRL